MPEAVSVVATGGHASLCSAASTRMPRSSRQSLKLLSLHLISTEKRGKDHRINFSAIGEIKISGQHHEVDGWIPDAIGLKQALPVKCQAKAKFIT